MALLITVLIAALAVVAAPVTVRVVDRAAGYPLAALLIAAAVVLARHTPAILAGQPLEFSATWARDVFGPGGDVIFALRADGLSVIFALLALIIGSVVFIYSAAYLPKKQGNQSFYLIMTAFTLAVLLLVLANDVVVLFIAWELVSLASFMLIARSGQGGEAGASRTLILTFIGGLTLLAALALAATATGHTAIDGILASEVWAERPGFTTLIALLIAASAFTKAAQFPFHFWLPEAMAAATPVSAFLHAAAVVKAGIYLLLRFSTVFHDVAAWNYTLIIIGMGTAIASAFFATQKTDLKQLTAYSTVSHLGWIVATIGVGTEAAIAAAIVHTLAHALFKSSLFMLIGVVDHEAGSRDIRRLGPLYKKMPFTFVSAVIAAASMASIPPLFGFVSKEGMLTAYQDAPAAALVLIAATIAAILTFTYSAKIIFGAFVDGPRDVSKVHEAPVRLWLPAALPGLTSLPMFLFFGLLDVPVDAAVAAVTGGHDYHSHLALWHGVNLPLIITVVVLAAGVIGVLARKKLYPMLEDVEPVPFTGTQALGALIGGAARFGKLLGWMANTLNPSRHLLWMLLVLLGLGCAVFTQTGVDGVAPAPRVEGLDNYWDLLPLAIVLPAVVAMAFTRSRLTSVVLIGAVGVGISLQMMLLGSPDVALTQFLVEALTVIIMMMVLRQQPRLFPAVPARRTLISAIIAVLFGVITFAMVYSMTGRRERSELAEWFYANTYDYAGGHNIVAIIIVEFRSFDTLGELSVLGMGGVVLAAMVTTMPRYPFFRGTHPAPFGQSELNALPLQYVVKLVTPVLIVLNVFVFLRGHNAPGGGFVAALIVATAFALAYLAKSSDSRIVGEKTPIYLTGFGVMLAVGTGFLGLLKGGFLYAIHGEFAGQHLTTSLIFDAGIYLAVLGMFTMAINALGGYLRPGVSDVTKLNYNRWDIDPADGDPIDHGPEYDDDFPSPINPSDRPRDMVTADQKKGDA